MIPALYPILIRQVNRTLGNKNFLPYLAVKTK